MGTMRSALPLKIVSPHDAGKPAPLARAGHVDSVAGTKHVGELELGLSKATAGVILRELITLEAQGMEKFFGEPEFDTAELMRAFYRNLWEQGMGRHEALRQAQLGMLTRNRARFGRGRPWSWGAFVLEGGWR